MADRAPALWIVADGRPAACGRRAVKLSRQRPDRRHPGIAMRQLT